MLWASEEHTTGLLTSSPLLMVGGLVVTAVGGVVTTYMSYLSTKAKLQYDGKMIALETKLVTVEKNHAECEVAHKETREKLRAVEDRCDAAEKTAAKLEGEQQATQHELLSLREDVNRLRELFVKKASGVK